MQTISAPSDLNALSLSRLSFAMDFETVQAIGEAERAVREFAPRLDDPLRDRALRDSCIHIEQYANGKMDGRQQSTRKFFRDKCKPPAAGDEEITELRIIEALEAATELGRRAIRPGTIHEIHRTLLAGTTRDQHKAAVRTSSRQTGGGRHRSFGTSYQPPDASLIYPLVEDLAAFMNKAAIPPVAQAAIADAQFILINPFVRANGKTARALCQLIFQHREVVDGTIFPLSVALAVSTSNYQRGTGVAVEALTQPQPDPASLNAWMSFYAQCCSDTAEEVGQFHKRAMRLQDTWIEQLQPRSDSAMVQVIYALPAMPVLTVNLAVEYTGRSFKRVSVALEELAEAGVLNQVTQGKRNRVFECPRILTAYGRIAGFQ